MGQKDVNGGLSWSWHPDRPDTWTPSCHVGDLGIDIKGPECSEAALSVVKLELPAGGALAEAVDYAWPGWLDAIDAAQGTGQLTPPLAPLPPVYAPEHGEVAIRWLGWLRLRGV